MKTLRGPAALAAVCWLLAAAACSADADAEDGVTVEPNADAVSEAERLYQMVNDGRAITDELNEIEYRVAKRCLEDGGFHVHDPTVFEETDYGSYGAAGYLTDAPVRAVPTVESAELWGFGVWTEFVRSPGNEDLAEELLTPEARLAFGIPEEDYTEPDSSEWDAEGAEYQAEWIEAYTGAPPLEDSMKGPQPDSEAAPGGCWLEMVETIYGEPYLSSSEEDGEESSYAVSHRPSPISTIEEFEDTGEARELLDGQDEAFDSCLIDRGYEGWEIGDEFYPPLWEYFGQMYDPAYFEEYGEEGSEVPEGPEEVPGDFLGVLELERAMAADFAACGQESGLRTALEQAWAALLVQAYQPIETDLVAWQTEMQGHLDNAQDYLQE